MGAPPRASKRVPCKTVSAEAPVSPREMTRRGLLGLLIALVILLASSYVVPYRDLWIRLTASVEPVKAVVHAGLFSPYLQMELTGLDRRTGMLKVHLTRAPAYPISESALDALYANPPEPMAPPSTTTAPATAPASAPAAPPATSLLRRRLAIESLAKGTVRLEFRDAQGRILGGGTLRISDLQRLATLDGDVPAPVIDKQIVVPASVDLLPE